MRRSLSSADQPLEVIGEGHAFARSRSVEFPFVGIRGIEGDPEKDKARIIVLVASFGAADPADRAMDTQAHGFGKACTNGALLCFQGRMVEAVLHR